MNVDVSPASVKDCTLLKLNKKMMQKIHLLWMNKKMAGFCWLVGNQ